MANFPQFGPPYSMDCDLCEASIMDALDGSLSVQEQAAFDRHIASCATCSQMLADAQRGAAWLEMLRTPRPEPSAALLERIILQTSGAESQTAHPTEIELGRTIPFVPAKMTPVSNPTRGVILPFRSRVAALGQTYLQPRLMMTAAMAFFSIALTMNLTGVRLSELHASDLTPSGISRNLNAVRGHAVRYYDNLPVVYELESRLNSLKSDDDDRNPYRPGRDAFDGSQSDGDAKPAAKPEQQPEKPEPKRQPGPGTSRRETPDFAPDRQNTFHTVSLNSSRKITKEGGQV
ncbi:Putative zinc-finger [Granulicella rosea]|uniref:Putative zinc-finger n=1 Tax=Granulicella rosea TaxID=474952 RepID=A0A239L8K7_9BACT|nr:zf-HC2 domain-containing protein [Granulicella rosea]SNT26946.1 Putative zinc-finger [Granulicella rosea]